MSGRKPKLTPHVGPKRAIAYDRVSTVVQSKVGYSGGADGYQLANCREHIDRKGYTYLDALTDTDSGKKWQIAGIMGAIERAKRGEYDVLVVAYSGRFARNLAKQETYEMELLRHGVEVEYLDLPVSRKDAGGKAMRQIFGVWNEYEGELIAHRTSQGRIRKAKQGKVVGSGPAPYGHRYVKAWAEEKGKHVPYGLEPSPETREVVEWIYSAIFECSCITIAERLTADGVPLPGTWIPSVARPRASVWSPSTVRGIIRNTAHRGLWRYGEEEVELGYALVDPATWHRAQEAMRSHGQHRQTRHPERIERAERYGLRGRLTCGNCGGAISTDDRQIPGASSALWPDGRQRRYLCARSVPSKARRMGKAVCSLPGLLAADERIDARDGGPLVGIEDLAWGAVCEFYTRPGELELRLAELDARTGEARTDYERRLAYLDQQIAEQVSIMDATEREKRRLASDDPRYGMNDAAGAQAVEVWKRFTASRAELAGRGGPGIMPVHRALVLEHAAYIRSKLPAGRRSSSAALRREQLQELYRALQLRGTVERDPDGQRVGRDARVRVIWEVFVDNGEGFLKLRVLSTATGARLLTLDVVPTAA